MSDEHRTPEQLWQEYETLKQTNPFEAAKYALRNRVFEQPRPPTTSGAATPPDTTAEDPRLAEYEALKKANPIVAARWAIQKGLFK
jgi:hypothetical protein